MNTRIAVVLLSAALLHALSCGMGPTVSDLMNARADHHFEGEARTIIFAAPASDVPDGRIRYNEGATQTGEAPLRWAAVSDGEFNLLAIAISPNHSGTNTDVAQLTRSELKTEWKRCSGHGQCISHLIDDAVGDCLSNESDSIGCREHCWWRNVDVECPAT